MPPSPPVVQFPETQADIRNLEHGLTYLTKIPCWDDDGTKSTVWTICKEIGWDSLWDCVSEYQIQREDIIEIWGPIIRSDGKLQHPSEPPILTPKPISYRVVYEERERG